MTDVHQLVPVVIFVSHISLISMYFFFSSDQNSEVKLGNPLLVLLQPPFQLLSYLLFDRQVSPERYGTVGKPHQCKKVCINVETSTT